MGQGSGTIRLYADLAWLWPLWGDHETDYAPYADQVTRLIREYGSFPARTLLDISCGGGKNVYNLKKSFRVTGLDLSPAMLRLAAALNPDCEFIAGDMRAFSLDRTFDAVLIDDGVSHLLSREELSAAFVSAFRHLRPGGVMVVTPDVTRETFRQNKTVSTPAVDRLRPKNTEVVFVENVYDPDPDDEQYEATMIYLIRERGRLRIETDRFALGLFSLDTWRRLLSETGFSVRQEGYAEGGEAYLSLACLKP